MTKYKVTITNRDNVEYEVDAKRPILDELRNQGVDLPYGCKYGGCITCAAKLTSGDVDQKRQVALNNWQLDNCLLYTSPSPRDWTISRMPSSA